MIGRRKGGAPFLDYDTEPRVRDGRGFIHWLETSRKLLIVSIVLAAVVAAAAAWLVFAPAPSTPDAVSPVPDVPSAVPEAQAPVASTCPPADPQSVSPETLVLASYGTQWVPGTGTLLPSSAAGGPGRPGSPPACFTRTPEGALYAAASFTIAMGAATTPDARIAVVRARASRSGAYPQLMDQLSANPGIAGPAATSSQLRVSGYRWLAYAPDRARLVLQFLRTDVAGQTVQIVSDLVWESDDWLVVVPPLNGTVYAADTTATVYTPWGPPA